MCLPFDLPGVIFNITQSCPDIHSQLQVLTECGLLTCWFAGARAGEVGEVEVEGDSDVVRNWGRARLERLNGTGLLQGSLAGVGEIG